jgi:hypothetical protein
MRRARTGGFFLDRGYRGTDRGDRAEAVPALWGLVEQREGGSMAMWD